jgi:microcystin degradation protein MlrC
MKAKHKSLSALQQEQNALYEQLRREYFEMKNRIELRLYDEENKTSHHMAHRQQSSRQLIWSRTL